jgi:DNA repair exonuclease SbcCD ATPase subunit
LTKEMRALLQELESKKAQVRALLAEDKVTEAEQEMEEVRALQKKIELQKEVEAMEDFGGDGQLSIPVWTGI